MAHWTTENSEAFIRRVTFDFWTQLQKRFDSLPLTQLELAQMFDVSESAVSQSLNNSKNPTLKTLFNYAQAAKLKFAIVPYEDTDPNRGPINSEIFTICWEKAGRPRTFGQAYALPSITSAAASGDSLIVSGGHAYYKLGLDHAANRHSDLVGQILFFSGAGVSVDAHTQTAITQQPKAA